MVIPEIDPVVDACYDELADVLYLSIGPPQPCLSEEDPPGCLLRTSLSDRAVSGLTIICFRDWFVPCQILAQLQAGHRVPEVLLRFLERLKNPSQYTL